MKNLLKKYLQKTYNWKEIYINYYNIDGANCFVSYYTDDSSYIKESTNINIWDMVMFLNNID